MRENYTHVLPEIMELLKNHEECRSIMIISDDIILEKQSGLKMFSIFRNQCPGLRLIYAMQQTKDHI